MNNNVQPHTNSKNLPRHDLSFERKLFSDMTMSWKLMRSYLLEIQRSPESVNGKLVMTFMKGLHTCDMSMKELHKSLRQKVTRCIHTSVAMTSLQDKILHYTWTILSLRVTGESLDLMDERKNATLQLYIDIDPQQIRDILNASTSGIMRKGSSVSYLEVRRGDHLFDDRNS